MAINGTLSDIGFVSLLQFPNSSRKTGLLTVITMDGKAEFYYRKGELVHARYGKKTGTDVLVDIVDWSEGQFTFEPGLEPEETTIKDDLHHVLMCALKERDERKKDQDENGVSPVELDAELSGRLDELMKSASGIEFICVVTTLGQLLARSISDSSFLKNIEPFMESITCLVSKYPGKATGKVFVEDTTISIAISGLDDNQTVIIAAGPEMKLGRLAMALSKISRDLTGV
jgi:predicted regulator of Ras-like GTPase activity (Roadblock/LC7/MglB family)